MKNRTLIIITCFLAMLVVLSVIAHSRNNRFEYIATDNELLMTNLNCIPDVVRSYESVKDIYGISRRQKVKGTSKYRIRQIQLPEHSSRFAVYPHRRR